MRGHLGVAKALLEISLAQYTPKEKVDNTRYSMNQQHHDISEENSDSGDDDDPKIYAHIVDDKFTISNVGEVSLLVKSHTTPLEYMQWSCPVGRWSGTPVTESPLIDYAIQMDNMRLLKFLLDLGAHYSTTKTDNQITPAGTFFALPGSSLQIAIQKGRIRMISEMLYRNGCGIPFADLVKASGARLEDTLKYYQGLSVYGKKRADWAAAGRRVQVQPMSGITVPPLLLAAKFGSLESLEYLLSDTPLRTLGDFAAANKDDKRIKQLSQAKGGIETTIAEWFGANSKQTSS